MLDRLCPEYMAMGMSYDEYWNGDPMAMRDYRKAYKIKTKNDNFLLWLQGMYIYEAIIDIAPILIPFAKNPKLQPYPKQPYDLYPEDKEKTAKEKEIERDKKNQAFVKAWVQKINQKKGETK